MYSYMVKQHEGFLNLAYNFSFWNKLTSLWKPSMAQTEQHHAKELFRKPHRPLRWTKIFETAPSRARFPWKSAGFCWPKTSFDGRSASSASELSLNSLPRRVEEASLVDAETCDAVSCAPTSCAKLLRFGPRRTSKSLRCFDAQRTAVPATTRSST